MSRGGAGRGQGRKVLPPAERTKPRSISLRPDEWAKFDRIGKTDWLRVVLAKAKEVIV
jgi:hypothetical protein